MKHLFLGFLLFITCSGIFAQEIDTVLIKQFSNAEYNAGDATYGGVASKDGIIYFANSMGVLIYDGSSWTLVKVKDQREVTSLLLNNDTLYIGSDDEIGYILTSGENKLKYQSLSHLVPDISRLDNVWQIKRSKYGIYFQSYNDLLLYHGDTVKWLGIKDSYLFNMGDKILASSYNGELRILEDDKIINSTNLPNVNNDAIFSLVPIKSDEYLIFTSENGGFIINKGLEKVQKWQVPIDTLFKQYGIYNTIRYHDNILISSTWTKGLLLMDMQGNLIKKINANFGGLPDQGLWELFIDLNDNIWIPSDHGIYLLRLSANNIVGNNFKPKTIIKGISSELGRITQIDNIFDPSYIVFDYTTPGFRKDDIEYSFYLEGYDNEWTPWTKIYKKEYTKLSHGKYNFHIRSRIANTDKVLSEANMKFGIVLPWYQQPRVYIVILFIIVIIITIIVRVRNMELRQAKVALEIKVNERTKQLVNEQNKLKQANEKLLTSNTELDNFVYRSSHDLIAPLKSLRGLIGITKLETKEKTLLEYISLMDKSVLKLETFINNIMEYSINSKADVIKNDIDLNLIIDEIEEDIEYYDKFKKIELIREIEEAPFKSDPKRLKIIINNLVTNAVKYHNMNQPHPYIKIVAKENQGNYLIFVEDNGLGIGQEHLNKIFNMFYRASSDSDGSGLGLYIVMDTTKKLKGEIKVTSEVNVGSTFSLHFPLN